jgi:hypothetical protein
VSVCITRTLTYQNSDNCMPQQMFIIQTMAPPVAVYTLCRTNQHMVSKQLCFVMSCPCTVRFGPLASRRIRQDHVFVRVFFKTKMKGRFLGRPETHCHVGGKMVVQFGAINQSPSRLLGRRNRRSMCATKTTTHTQLIG